VSKKVRDIIFNSYISNTSKNPLNSLTNKELEIALLYIKGQGNLEICNSLNIKKSTVSTFKSKIFEKLGVTNIPSLVEIFKLYYKNN
jgi:DNA-binding NarL/FixJ family response regulator